MKVKQKNKNEATDKGDGSLSWPAYISRTMDITNRKLKEIVNRKGTIIEDRTETSLLIWPHTKNESPITKNKVMN